MSKAVVVGQRISRQMTALVLVVLTALSGAVIAGCGGASIAVPKLPKLPSLNLGPVPSEANAARYGAVHIPGHVVLTLPRGDVALSFSYFAQGDVSQYQMVPALNLEVSGPTGGPPYPKVTSSQGNGQVSEVNGHVWFQINLIHVPKAGRYRVSVSGRASGYINPQLLLGR